MATLRDKLLNEEVRPKLVDDCCQLLDREVAGKKGISGLAVKGAYATVKAIKPGFVRGVVDFLLDEWVDKLEAYYVRYHEDGAAGSFGLYCGTHRGAVAESLLEVTDARARSTKHATAAKLYGKLRPNAKTQVEEAVPNLGAVVDRYL